MMRPKDGCKPLEKDCMGGIEDKGSPTDMMIEHVRHPITPIYRCSAT